MSYPPECVEGKFSELRLNGVLRSSLARRGSAHPRLGHGLLREVRPAVLRALPVVGVEQGVFRNPRLRPLDGAALEPHGQRVGGLPELLPRLLHGYGLGETSMVASQLAPTSFFESTMQRSRPLPPLAVSRVSPSATLISSKPPPPLTTSVSLVYLPASTRSSPPAG